MIKHFTITDAFKTVPHLRSSLLMQRFPEGIPFATDKVNVIVGPNGSGKSALMRTLSLLTLSNLTGVSTFDPKIFSATRADENWTRESRYSERYLYLDGAVCDHDCAPALYYRPGHIPGNESWINTCLFTGYSEQAAQYREATKERSSGQQCLALLSRIKALISGETTLTGYDYLNWPYGEKPLKPAYNASHHAHKAYELLNSYANVPENAVPVVLLDEPEQSLDLRAEIELWKLFESADLSRVQIIVATHSMYPMLHPERFNIVEAVEGYVQELHQLML